MLDSSKLKKIADDNFTLDEKRLENTVGKGEIARRKQFLLFPQCFQKTCAADTKEPWLIWERVKWTKQSLQECGFVTVKHDGLNPFPNDKL